MKTNLLKSIFISLILLVGVSNAWAADITSDGTARLYFNMSAINWWIVQAKDGANYAYFFKSGTSSNAWSAKAVQYNGNTYYVVIPKGTWNNVILTRNSTAGAGWGGNLYNQTSDIELSNTSNYLSKFKSGNDGENAAWGTPIKPASTGKLTASSTSVNIGTSVTLTASLTSNNTINDIKSTSYSISPNSGASISSGKFTATKAGTYTVTATITYNPDGYTSLTSTVKPTATITVEPWTITWDPNGGSVTPTSSEYDGATTVTLPTPTRDGYDFQGWYTAGSGGTKINDIGTTTKPTGNVTYYAQWELANYTITYDNLKGATHTNPATYTINSATITFTAPTTKPTGYTFANWTPASITKGSTGDVTVTANWTASTSTVTLDQQSGTGGTTSVTATYGSAMPDITKPARTGYNFAGYYTEKNGGGTQYYYADGSSATTWALEGAQTLYAQWTINQYTIKYLVNSGTGTGTIAINQETASQSGTLTADYNTTHTLTATPAKNYRVAGWYDESDQLLQGGAEAEEVATYTITSLASDMTVKVVFAEANEKLFPITASIAEGSGTVSPLSQDAGPKTKARFTAIPDPGYRFDHWTYDNTILANVVENNSAQQGEITCNTSAAGTITANFIRVYTVDFMAIPFVVGNVAATVDENAITSGDAVDAGKNIVFTASIKNEYQNHARFVRWETETGKEISTDNPYTLSNIEKDTLIKAIFEIDQFTLNFSASDGGHVSAKANNSNITSPATLNYGTSVTLTATPSANCAFDGWYEGSTKKSADASYTISLKADKTIEARFTQPTTVYFKAIEYWKKDYPRYAIYYWGDGQNNYGWVDMTNVDCNGDIYEGYVPVGYNKFKFVRLAPSTTNAWANKWNETAELTTTNNANKMYIHPHIYLKPNSNWKQANARFAARFWNAQDETWMSMTDTDGDGVYSCEIPAGYTDVIFCRMNPSEETLENNWDNKWNQTNDLKVPANDNTLYTVKDDTWDKGGGTWSAGPQKNGWQALTTPSYKITIQPTENGSIIVKNISGTTVATGTTLNLDDKINITFTPKDGYELINYHVEYASETETPGVYAVCGPTKITAEFAVVGTAQTVYLRPNEDWLKDDPIFAAYAYKNGGKDTEHDWYVMTTKADDYTGSYSCNISNQYDWVIFVRIKPNGRDNSDGTLDFKNAWNQTIDLQIMHHTPRFAIGEEKTVGDKQKYDGAWEENTPIWGLITNYNNWQAEKAIFMGYPGKLNTEPPFVPQHAFKLYNFLYAEGKYFGNSGTMRRDNSGQWWTMDVNNQDNCQMKLDVKGDYTYQLRFLTVGPELRKQISVIYPNEDVYYLNYGEDNRWSYAIANTADATKTDKVSFFVNEGTATINLIKENNIKETQTFTIATAGVYTFTLKHGTTPTIDDEFQPYTGNYYIRTDAAEGGWDNFKKDGNKLTYSSHAANNQDFDHYFCKWISNEDDKKQFVAYSNVKFCVANDYSHALTDELDEDDIIDKEGVPTGCLPQSANVRFAWSSETNKLSRAYLSGSSNASDRFLVIEGNEYLKDINGNPLNVSGLKPNEQIFADKGNWTYQADVQANTQTKIVLTAKYNEKNQFFFGKARTNDEGEAVLADTENKYHKVRMIYNFKTNNFVAAWLLDQNNTVEGGEQPLNSNMLVIRKQHEQAQQIQLKKDLTGVRTAYGVMTFDKDYVNDNTKSIYERALYWVSFPFNVRIRDVFGFGEYMDTWIMEYYDGAKRAEKGAWVDSESYWTYITDLDYVLEAGTGYILCLDLEKMTPKSSVFANTDEVSLYFPSKEEVGTLSNTQIAEVTFDPLTCSIQRDYRYIYDSNWRVIGVPKFADLTTTIPGASIPQVELTEGEEAPTAKVGFYYNYITSGENIGKYAVEETTSATFKTMYAYMVQYAGTLYWTTNNITQAPQQMAARRNADAGPEKVSLRLEIAQDDITADKTFIQLQEEDATADFDMNKDLTKIINAGANIYTLVGEGNIQTAGNVLPMDECVVPVGVKVDAAGEYTIRMPEGTESMVVELIDYYTNTRTNLLLFDYTVELTAGTSNDRFALHIQPEKSGVATDIDQLTGSDLNAEGVQKYIIDGRLYLKKNGVLYDAQGHRL